MILSDREIRAAIKRGRIVVDPQPAEEQYDTSALDLRLGEELLELKSQEELQQAEPAGVERTLIIGLAKVPMTSLLRSYAKSLVRESDGSFVLGRGSLRWASRTSGSNFLADPRSPPGSRVAVRSRGSDWRFILVRQPFMLGLRGGSSSRCTTSVPIH